MKTLFIDIETFGNKPSLDDIEAPSNYKDPEVIRKYKEEGLDKAWRGNALKSLQLEVIAISFAVDDGSIVGLTNANGEEAMFVCLQSLLMAGIGAQQMQAMELVTHYGKIFDIPIIRHRCIKYGLKDLYNLFNVGRYTERCHDTHEMWGGTDYKTHYSLSKIAAFLDIPSKTIMNGSQVHDYYLKKELDLISTYCNEDVSVLRDVYKKLRFEY